jgi:DNA modification methylase
MDYVEFLKTKVRKNIESGFILNKDKINKMCKNFQVDIIEWSLKKGKAAIFADCGLGKTLMQLNWAYEVSQYTDEPVLILAPLCVSKQTILEGVKFGYIVNDLKKNEKTKGINILNYENIDKINADDYAGIVLDESSILKAFSGKTKQIIINKFKQTPYKLCCTATPSPNDYMELLNHSDFLDVMKSNEALSCWFINDTMDTGKYRLKKHAEKDFWEWVSSWAVSISMPSDLGYSNDDFVLPKLNENLIELKDIEIEKDPDMLFADPEINATTFHKIRRQTIKEKVVEIKKILKQKANEQIMIWVESNYEADLLNKELPGVVEIRGSHSTEIKEKTAMDFVNGNIKILISKPSIFGFGMNFQNCHNVIFCGLSYSFESYYQTVRRFWRYGQKKEVNIYKIISIYENDIYKIVNQKQLNHEKMKKEMRFYKEYFNINKSREFKMDYKKQSFKTDVFEIINGDCIEEIRQIEDESLHFQIFSPPFSQLYIYSDSYRDMGNTKNDKEFFQHFYFLIKELYRTLKSGRLCAVHCKQLVNYINRDGASGIRDFRGDIIRAFQNAGFVYHTEVCIWKDPVIEMQRTKSHGLLYRQLRADSSYSRMGLPDYLTVFRKWTDKGDLEPVNWKTHDNFLLDKWQKYASPVWFDIKQTNCLNIKMARDNEDEKHICPLQLDVIERAVEMWTNPGDVVFTPFAGIGSEIYQSILLGRKGIGIELKKNYYDNAIKYCLEAENKIKESNKSLFDM